MRPTVEKTDDNGRAEGAVSYNALHDVLRAEFRRNYLGIGGEDISWPAPKYPSFFLFRRQLEQPVWIAKTKRTIEYGEKGKPVHTYLNGVPSEVLEEEVLAVQSCAATRLTTDPFLNTSCCSSVPKECTSCGYQRSFEPKRTNPEQMDHARPVPSRAWRL